MTLLKCNLLPTKVVVIHLEFDRVLPMIVPFRLVKGLAGRCHINPDYYYYYIRDREREESNLRPEGG